MGVLELAQPSVSSAFTRRERLVRQLSERIVTEFAPTKIVLFGSSATGTARPDSDIDLLVIFDKLDRSVKRSVAAKMYSTFWNWPLPIDFVVASKTDIAERTVPSSIYASALHNGLVLYDKP